MHIDLPYVLVLLGRLLLGGLFVFGGVRHLFLIPILTQVIAARGVPFPRLVLLAGSAFQFIAGILVILGLFVPAAAFGLVLFTLVASIMLLNFWTWKASRARTPSTYGCPISRSSAAFWSPPRKRCDPASLKRSPDLIIAGCTKPYTAA
jgi:putative oxidoreductase